MLRGRDGAMAPGSAAAGRAGRPALVDAARQGLRSRRGGVTQVSGSRRGGPLTVLPIASLLFAVFFETPLTAAAVAGGAVSVPIIIHLLNRRRFRIVQWAAMRFLLSAQRKNARR